MAHLQIGNLQIGGGLRGRDHVMLSTEETMFSVRLSRIAGSAVLVGLLTASSGKAWLGESADDRPKVLGATFSNTEVVADGRKQPAVRVDAVDPNSAIGKAGIQSGDVIYVVWQAEGRWRYDYPRASNLACLLFTLPLDEMLRFDILRQNGKLTKATKVRWTGDKSATVNIDIVPLDRTAALAAIPREIVQVQDLPGKAWRRLVPADPESLRGGVPQGQGLVYIDPDGKSQFSDAGLKHGDIVVALTSGRRGAPRYDLNGIGSAVNAFRQLASQDKLEVHYIRPQRYSGKTQLHKSSLKFPIDLLALSIPPTQTPPPPAPTPPAAPAAPPTEPMLMLATESVAVTPQLVGPGEDFE
ncbi:MAG: hypothetical protein IH582_02700, partial [Afipia sp.]|nr:hypothetical protein [Afipia sp.]